MQRVEPVDRAATGYERVGRGTITPVERLPKLRDLRFHACRSNIAGVLGAVILIVAMLTVGPIGLFVVGAIFSGLAGWGLSDAADHPAEAQSES